MNNKKKTLLDFKKNVYSQSGEDGIIEKIFSIIGTTNKVAIEFGAWDGFYLSNTANLWSKKKWKGILIEANKKKFEILEEKTKNFDCLNINTFVEIKGQNSLDSILKKYKITLTPDLLSIDIDSDDYHILNSLKKIKPRVIICEYNPTMPPDIEIIQKPGSYLGSSVLAIKNLAEKKGYKTVALTESNIFLVKKTLFPKLSKLFVDIKEAFPYKYLTYLISDYSGGYFVSQVPPYGLKWPTIYNFIGNGTKINPYSELERRINISYHDNYENLLNKFLFNAVLLLRKFKD